MELVDSILIPALLASFVYIAQLIKTISDNKKTTEDLIIINDNLKKTKADLEAKLEENRKTTEHYGEKTLLALENEKTRQNKLLKLIPKEKAQDALAILSDSCEEIKLVIEETQAINILQNLSLDTSSLEQKCPQCGKKMADDGYKNTPWGLVWHYRCPQHGSLPGNNLNDIWDE